jgi:hypothetical protein
MMIRCCGTCGKVLDQEVYTDEPTFVKDNTGQVGFIYMLCNPWIYPFLLPISEIWYNLGLHRVA